jgi:hypothetical protein
MNGAQHVHFTYISHSPGRALDARVSRVRRVCAGHRAARWSRCAGSNRGPAVYKTAALPTELHRRVVLMLAEAP